MRAGLFLLIAAAFVGLTATSPSAQSPASAPEKPWYKTVTYNVLAEASYTYNFNRPDSGLNDYRAFDYEDKTVELDQVQFVMQKSVSNPGDGGFRVDVSAGSTVPMVTAAYGLFRNINTGETQHFDLQQAFVSYVFRAGRGLRLDVGKFFTYLCYEVVDSYSSFNDNASRSFAFTLGTPATHTGLRMSYPFTDKVSGLLVLVNGWDDAIDNNKVKSVGLQVSVAPTPKLSLFFNWMGGAEEKDNDSDRRYLYEITGTYKATDRVTLGFDALYGTEQNAAGPDQNGTWDGIAGYLRFQATDRFALSLRAEVFDDRQGVRSGVAQKLKEVTLTPEYRLDKHFVVRGDLRCDWSDQDVFQKRALYVKSQPTASVQVLYVF
jgi:hypothetical protein